MLDARLDPAHVAGVVEGDAHVIRGASDDAVRSPVSSHKLLDTQAFVVAHHTDCAKELFTDAISADLLADSLDTAVVDTQGWHDIGKGPGSPERVCVKWLTFRNPHRSGLDDVQRIRRRPLVPDDLPVRGFVYDVKTDRLHEGTETQETP